MFQTESLRKIQILNQLNFSLSFSLPSLLSLSPPLSRARLSRAVGRVPSARPGRLPATWFAQTGHLNPLGLATRRHPVRARRGPPPRRHGDAVRARPTAPRPFSRLDSPRVFPRSSGTFPTRPSPLLSPSATPREPLLPGTAAAAAISAAAPSSPWSSPLHPFPRQTDPVASSLDLCWCSPTCSPPPRPAGNAAAADQSAAGRPSPRRGHHRPPSRAPSPSKGSSCAPLAFPQWGPHRRSLSSPGKAAPYLLCSFPVQGPALRRNRSPGGQAQKRHELKTANFENT